MYKKLDVNLGSSHSSDHALNYHVNIGRLYFPTNKLIRNSHDNIALNISRPASSLCSELFASVLSPSAFSPLAFHRHMCIVNCRVKSYIYKFLSKFKITNYI